ncbi:MAG: SH3 domain-containing protein [Chloroflexi bacterium]|nr:SH3 domain-containing protein [Chloroflexota bacterium]
MKHLALLLIAALVLTMLPVSSVEASPDETIIPLSWHAEYFDNQYLIGPPMVVREEGALNHNWGTNAPFDNIPADYFTARWATRPMLDAGTYRFSVTADDSVKVTVDYINVFIDTINNPQPGDTLTATFDLTAGSHYFQVDYRERTGNASISATLEILDGEGVPPLPATPAAYVTAFSLRLRSGPGLTFRILGHESRDTIVDLIGRNDDATWAQVTVPDGTTGWMGAAWLDPNVDLTTLPVVTVEAPDRDIPENVPPLPATPAAYVTAHSLRVRSGPGLNFTILGQEPENTIVHLTGRNADATWVQVTVPDGITGWMGAVWLDPNVDLTTLPVVTTDIPDDETPDLPTDDQQIGLVTAFALTIRSEPDISGEVLGFVTRFTPLTLVGRNAAGTWLMIVREDDSTGWVSAAWVLSASNIFALPVIST